MADRGQQPSTPLTIEPRPCDVASTTRLSPAALPAARVGKLCIGRRKLWRDQWLSGQVGEARALPRRSAKRAHCNI